MSRSGYSYDLGRGELAMYRGQVVSATKGKRGQKMLRDLAEAMDAMPVRRLIAGELEDDAGEVCSLGCVGRSRGVDRGVEGPEELGKALDIARQLAAEVMFENDEVGPTSETPEERWQRMRQWVRGQVAIAAE